VNLMASAAEQDPRGKVALEIPAYLASAEFHGGATPLLDGAVDRWLTSGKPDVPQISGSLVRLRSQLARYVDRVDRGGHVPEWFRAALAKASASRGVQRRKHAPRMSRPMLYQTGHRRESREKARRDVAIVGPRWRKMGRARKPAFLI